MLKWSKVEPSKPVSRVLYPSRGKDGDHLSSPSVTGRVKRPTQGTSRASQSPSIRSCSRWGLPSRLVTQPLVSSYLTISPLPALASKHSYNYTLHLLSLNNQPQAVCFCGTFHRVTPPGSYPASCPVELGLSSPIIIGAVTRFT